MCDLVGRGDAGNVSVGLLDDFAILYVDTADCGQCTSGSAVVRNELRYDGKYVVGVDCVRGAGPVELNVIGLKVSKYLGQLPGVPKHQYTYGMISPSVWVEVAAVLVAVSIVAVSANAARLGSVAGSIHSARVGRHSVGDGVGLPDIHFSAARADAANSGVGIGRRPVDDVGLCHGLAMKVAPG